MPTSQGPKPDRNLLRRLQLEGKFVAAYVGTVGMAHGIGTLLDAARQLRERTDIAFVVVGTGAQQAELADTANREGLSNVIFVGAVSKAEVRDYWRLCDARACVAARHPTVPPCDSVENVRGHGDGARLSSWVSRGRARRFCWNPGGGLPFRQRMLRDWRRAVVTLADDPARCTALGKRGRVFAAEKFSRETLAKRMLDEMSRVGAK
jgi:colanic acid biosynthesis glycosyl transferase WcaI